MTWSLNKKKQNATNADYCGSPPVTWFVDSLHISRLPLDDLLWEVLVDELHVVRLELLDVWLLVRLAVEVVGVESLDSGKLLLVTWAHHPVVGAGRVPWVEAVESDHGKSLLWQGALVLADVVEVLVVAPAEHDVVETAAWGVDAVLGAVDRVFEVWVLRERLVAVDDALVECTADWEGVTNDVPLALGVEEEEELSEVVDEAGNLHPSWLAVTSDGLGTLEQMLDLAELGVGVALIDQGVELLHGLPDGHLSSGLGLEIVSGLEVVGDGVLGVLLLVEVLDSVVGFFVVSELSLVLLGIELRGITHLSLEFLLGLVLQDVDLLDLIDHLLKSKTISVSAERLDWLLNCDRHYDCVVLWREERLNGLWLFG